MNKIESVVQVVLLLTFYSIKTKVTKLCDTSVKIFIGGLISAMPENTWYKSHMDDRLIRKCFHATKVNIIIFCFTVNVLSNESLKGKSAKTG